MKVELSPDARIYADQVLQAIPRLLSSQDRDETTPTYGCFDREYWAWATKEFSNIDLQRGVYPLAFVYATPFSGNVYFQQKKILSWIKAGLLYWCRSQHPDGSFDHLYPNEHSYVGVAFTLFDLCQAYAFVSPHFDPAFRRFVMNHMICAAQFLLSHDEGHGFISNHRAGTACALYHMHLLTNNRTYLQKAKALITSISRRQSPEGWFYEYSGPDPGYETLGIHYLSLFYRMSADPAVLSMLSKAVGFVSHFIQPNRTIGGEYGSRVTEIYFPSGFELLTPHIPMAESIASFMRPALQDQTLVHLHHMDIRNFVPFLVSYCVALDAALHQKELSPLRKIPLLPFQQLGWNYFPHAQLATYSTPSCYIILGLGRGVIRAYRNNDLVFSHCGYFGVLPRPFLGNPLGWIHPQRIRSLPGIKISTQMPGSGRDLRVSPAKTTCTLGFFKVPFRVMTPLRFLLLRAFNMTIGRSYSFNNLFRKYIIVNLFIAPHAHALFTMNRHISLTGKELVITDRIERNKRRFASLQPMEKSTTILIASSKYFQRADLASHLHSLDLSKELNAKGKVQVRYTIPFSK